jgi:hypothetical protein
MLRRSQIRAAANEYRAKEALLQMAQVWQRLADQYGNSTPTFSQRNSPEQPVVQQQQQIQSKDDEEKS